MQDNRSFSNSGVLRGLHSQKKHPQGQLVFVVEGEIFDVCVDLRRRSPTFKKWFGTRLSAREPKQVYMPPGIAHGFCVLGNAPATVHYKCSGLYRPNDEGGLNWRDPEIAIAWPLEFPVMSERDRNYPFLKDLAPADFPHV